MVSVILAYSPECKQRALANGFIEQTVLVKHEDIKSAERIKRAKREGEVLRELSPYQYFLGDFWGAGVD